jgi:hypothetical protein
MEDEQPTVYPAGGPGGWSAVCVVGGVGRAGGRIVVWVAGREGRRGWDGRVAERSGKGGSSGRAYGRPNPVAELPIETRKGDGDES